MTSSGRRELITPVLGAAVFVLVALLTTGGDLTTMSPNEVPTTWVDVALIVGGGLAAAALLIRRQRGAGTLTFCLFAAVAALTALSISWSVAPDQSWAESGRTVAYLAVFGLGLVLARGGTGSSRSALMAITWGATALCLWALAVKVLDLSLYGQSAYGRLLSPTQYWNNTGLTGAMALPGLIWRASRRGGAGWPRGLACAGISIAAAVTVLSYSRSASAAAVIAVVVLLFFLSACRRSVTMLVLGLLGAVPICTFALLSATITKDSAGSSFSSAQAPTLHRAGSELILGAITLVAAVLVAGIAGGLARRLDTTPQSPERLARFDLVLRVFVLLVPVAVLAGLIFNSRGFGEIVHLWSRFTSTTTSVGDQANRIFDVANSRSAYWRQALSIGAHNLLGGTGAGSFFPAFLRYPEAHLTPTGLAAKHAHSYVLQTFADLGLVGVVLNLALFTSWCRDALASVRDRVDVADHDARWALIAVVIAFGVSSALDWTWFYPAVAVPGLFAAGWLAGVGRCAPRSEPAATRPLGARPGAILALTALLAVTLAVAWESIQPMRSSQSQQASQTAQLQDHVETALADARSAVHENPLSSTALSRLSTVYGALGDPVAERATLVKATQVQPNNPQPFYALGSYLVCRRDFSAAVAPLRRANLLDVTDINDQVNWYHDAVARVPALACRTGG